MSAAAPARIVPTPEQRAIVEYPLRPLRVAAGAGTGKTTTMALRLARLVATEDIPPEAALGVTFTNKAAAELADRIRLELPELAAAGREVQVATYHGFAYDLLREFGAAVGVERRSEIVTPGYARQLLRDALAEGRYQALDLTHAAGRVDDMAVLASHLGDHLLTPAGLAAALGPPTGDVARQRAELLDALARYQEAKRRIGAVDYADLIRLAHHLLATRPEVAAAVRARYRVVLLDEYQDTNPAQREMLLRVFGEGFPVTAVGDPDQTIYEWRGASLDNFAGFPTHFPDAAGEPARTLPLVGNRRSDRAILAAANAVRAGIGGEGADLVARDGAAAGELTCAWFRSALDEAQWLAAEARRLHDEEGVAWSDIGILFRKNQQIGLVRDALEDAGVPVEVAALGGLLGVPEVADLHAWLRIIGRHDDAAALARLLLGSRFRLGLGDLMPLAGWVRARQRDGRDDDETGPEWTMLEAIYELDECEGVDPETRRRLDEFLALYRALLEEAQGITLVELCRRILDRTGAWPDVEAMDDAARLSARLNLYRFLDLAEEWSPLEGRPSLDAFLDYLDLLVEEGAASDELDTARLGSAEAVALLTVHRAKGLEWPVVFLPALCQGTFPATMRRSEDPIRFAPVLPYEHRLDALEPLPEDENERKDLLRVRHLAQEWRTAYVGVTRAQHRLYATGAYWFSGSRPKRRSEVYDMLAGLPDTIIAHDEAEPGQPPEALRLESLTAPAPDPHFDDWQEALRRAAADPKWPTHEAERRGRSEPYHAQVDQLRITLDGLPDPPVPEPDVTRFATSVTGLVTYARCPLQFRWSEVDRLPRRPSPAARRGVEVHRRIELHNRGALALDDVDEGFYDLPEEAGVGAPATAAYDTFLSSRFAGDRPKLVETPFDLEVGEGRVRGRIDAVYEPEPGTWEIVDFKSGSPRPDPAARVQLEAYALAATDIDLAADRPDRIDVTFAYLGDGLTEMRETVDAAWLDGARRHLETLVSGAAAGEFPAAPGAQCASCDFLRFCEAGRQWVAAGAATGAVP